jgi:hypothetical protein
VRGAGPWLKLDGFVAIDEVFVSNHRYPIWYPIFSATPLVLRNALRLNCLVDKGFAQGR